MLKIVNTYLITQYNYIRQTNMKAAASGPPTTQSWMGHS